LGPPLWCAAIASLSDGPDDLVDRKAMPKLGHCLSETRAVRTMAKGQNCAMQEWRLPDCSHLQWGAVGVSSL
jgi:hypothetical protein